MLLAQDPAGAGGVGASAAAAAGATSRVLSSSGSSGRSVLRTQSEAGLALGSSLRTQSSRYMPQRARWVVVTACAPSLCAFQVLIMQQPGMLQALGYLRFTVFPPPHTDMLV